MPNNQNIERSTNMSQGFHLIKLIIYMKILSKGKRKRIYFTPIFLHSKIIYKLSYNGQHGFSLLMSSNALFIDLTWGLVSWRGRGSGAGWPGSCSGRCTTHRPPRAGVRNIHFRRRNLLENRKKGLHFTCMKHREKVTHFHHLIILRTFFSLGMPVKCFLCPLEALKQKLNILKLTNFF